VEKAAWIKDVAQNRTFFPALQPDLLTGHAFQVFLTMRMSWPS